MNSKIIIAAAFLIFFFAGSSLCLPKLSTKGISLEVTAISGKTGNVEKENKDTKVSGTIFFQYYKPIQNPSSTSKNGFDLTRVYVDLKKKLDKNASVRLTFDAGRIDSSLDPSSKSQTLFNYIKFAYADLPLIQKSNNNFNLRIGLQPTAWTGWVESFWAHRYIAKVLGDNEGLLNTADFGIGAYGKVAFPFINEIEFNSTLLNGGGFKKAENNSAKDISLRLNSIIFNSDNLGTVSIGALVNMKDQLSSAATASQLNGLLAAFSNKTYGNIYGEYLSNSKISGYSIAGFVYPSPNIFSNISFIGRIDFYDPDSTVTNDQINRTILGAAYDFGKNVQIAFDIQNKTIGSGNLESLAYIQSMISF